jgi:hypothetical protein
MQQTGPDTWAWTGGLTPGPNSMYGWSDEYFSPPPAVWFTNTPTYGFGRLTESGEQRKYEIGITVDLPPNSKRLVHWEAIYGNAWGKRGGPTF